MPKSALADVVSSGEEGVKKASPNSKNRFASRATGTGSQVDPAPSAPNRHTRPSDSMACRKAARSRAAGRPRISSRWAKKRSV